VDHYTFLDKHLHGGSRLPPLVLHLQRRRLWKYSFPFWQAYRKKYRSVPVIVRDFFHINDSYNMRVTRVRAPT
jgi:hypothetical protein